MCMIYRGLFLVKCTVLDLVAHRQKPLFLTMNKDAAEKAALKGEQ